MAEFSRKHNNANVLCLGSRLKIAEDEEEMKNIVQAFIHNFYEGGRHDRRLSKIRDIENMNIEGR